MPKLSKGELLREETRRATLLEVLLLVNDSNSLVELEEKVEQLLKVIESNKDVRLG